MSKKYGQHPDVFLGKPTKQFYDMVMLDAHQSAAQERYHEIMRLKHSAK